MTLMLNSVFQVVFCTWNPFRSMVSVQLYSHVRMQNNCLCVIIRFIVEVVPDKKKIEGRKGEEADTGRKTERKKQERKGKQPHPSYGDSWLLGIWFSGVRMSICDSRCNQNRVCTHKIQRSTVWTDVVCWNLQSIEIPSKTKTNKKNPHYFPERFK